MKFPPFLCWAIPKRFRSSNDGLLRERGGGIEVRQKYVNRTVLLARIPSLLCPPFPPISVKVSLRKSRDAKKKKKSHLLKSVLRHYPARYCFRAFLLVLVSSSSNTDNFFFRLGPNIETIVRTLAVKRRPQHHLVY